MIIPALKDHQKDKHPTNVLSHTNKLSFLSHLQMQTTRIQFKDSLKQVSYYCFCFCFHCSLSLSLSQFPLGRRAACDIYWHGVSFHDNENIISGQVNKFPGISPLLPFPSAVKHLTPTLVQLRVMGWLYFSSQYLMCTQYSVITTGGI